jgi:CheY-like chemotaxis protein
VSARPFRGDSLVPRALAAALLALAACAAPPARGQGMGGASIDFVRVEGRGRHLALVSVLDPQGQPLRDLEHAFTVQLDGAAVTNLAAQSLRVRCPRAALTVVVDGTLLGRDALPGVQDALRALAREQSAGDRLRLVGAGHSVHSRETAVGEVEALAGGARALADDATPMLYDALFEAARGLSRRADDEAGAILLVTRGGDGGSDRTSLEVLALARTQARLTPVTVVLVGDEGGASEADRLQRLAEHTGGAVAHVTSPADLPSLLPALAARALGRWVLTFDAPEWSDAAPRHRLEISVERAGERRQASLEYLGADVLPVPWWRAAWVWIVPLLLLLAAGAAFLWARPRQQFLLVHDGGDEDGSWYEAFATPVTVGAVAGNDLVFADVMVSRNHAVFERRGRAIELVDLNSENGTLVNGERIARRALADGDRVSFGPDVHLVYEARA